MNYRPPPPRKKKLPTTAYTIHIINAYNSFFKQIIYIIIFPRLE